MKRLLLFAVTLFAVLAVPASASAWSITATPSSIEKFGYGTGTGHTTTGNSTWTSMAVRASDGSFRSNVGQTFTPSANGWQVQWSDGASVGTTEKIDTDSDMRLRFQFGTSGKPVGVYSSTWRLSHTNASPTTKDVPLTAYVQPWNQCTDGLDNDSDGSRDWRQGAGGSTAAADADCTDMNDTSEGGGAATAPAAPSNLTASALSQTEIRMQWTDNATTETSYKVHYQNATTGSGNDFTIAANSTSYTFTGLQADTNYDVWVYAVNSVGQTQAANPSFVRVKTNAGTSSAACSDGLDNDNDTFIDYPADQGCTSATDTDEANAAPQPACNDGINNDAPEDTLIDYPADPGCSSATDDSEADPPPAAKCANGLDDDSDTKIDYPADPGCSSATDDDETDPASGAWWKPTKTEGPWYWQISGSLNLTRVNTTSGINIVDVDPDETSQSTLASWKSGATGRRAICYFSAGTSENWRSDYNQFTAAMKGNSNGWPGENWLDIRRTDIRPIMQARMQRCKNEGYDAIEPDNIDGYSNNTGFPLTSADQITYNTWLADTAHSLGLGAMLKNDTAQVTQLQPKFDGAVVEQCQEYGECASYNPFLTANKPVYQAEYQTGTAACGPANTAGRWAEYRDLDLTAGGRFDKCWP